MKLRAALALTALMVEAAIAAPATDLRIRGEFTNGSNRDVSALALHRSTDDTVAKAPGQAFVVASDCRKSAVVRVVVTQTLPAIPIRVLPAGGFARGDRR